MAKARSKQPKSKPVSTVIWQVAWSNPHRIRPKDYPEIMLSVRVMRYDGESMQTPDEIYDCWEEMRPYGYSICCAVDTPPTRRLSLESKQRMRRRNLWKRLLKRYPMFVSEWYADQVQARTDYYGPYVPGEFADINFYQTTMGNLRTAKRD